MEILTIYEKAKEELEKASAASLQNGLNISSITLIYSDKDVFYTGVNWSRINDEFLIEQTCSEYEAMSRLLFDGNSNVSFIITLDASTKLPVNPCNECQKLLVTLNQANISCTVITGEDTSIVLSELNPELLELIPQPEPEAEIPQESENSSEQNTENAEDAQSADSTDSVQDTSANEAAPAPDLKQDGSAQSVKAFDTSELEMIFDDWESADDSSGSETSTENRPFNIDAVTAANESSVQEAIQQQAGIYQQQPMNNMYQQQQPMGGMYQQQPMNNMYMQQQMGGMYQQQPMNNMYMQQPMNNMYMQQPVNNAMNNMYQQANGGMNAQQQMGGMYQQQMNSMYMQPNQQMNSMYMQPNQQMNSMYMQPNDINNGQGQQNSMINNSMYMQTGNGNNSNTNAMNSMYIPPSNNQPGAAAPKPVISSPDVAAASRNISSATSVYGTSSGDNNNALFKDRLNSLLNTHSTSASSNEVIDDVLQSAKEKKKAAKMDAKYLKKFKNEEFQ